MPHNTKAHNNANDRKTKHQKKQKNINKSQQTQDIHHAQYQQKQSAQAQTNPSISADNATDRLQKNIHNKERIAAAKNHLDSASKELKQHLESLRHIEEYTPELYEDLHLKIYAIKKKIDTSNKVLVALGDNTGHKKIKIADGLIEKINVHVKELAIQNFLNDLETHFVDMEEQLRSAQERSDTPSFFKSQTDSSSFFKFQKLINELNDCKKTCENQCTGKNANPEKAIETLQTSVKDILTKQDNAQLLNEHRGSYVWRSLISILEKLEKWLRELKLPWSNHKSPLLSARARYFSTKSSKKTEEFIENISNLTAPHIKKL